MSKDLEGNQLFDLTAAVAASMNEAIASGKVALMIEKQIEKLVSDCLEQALRGYGKLGKQFTEAIEKSIDLNGIDISTYNARVRSRVRELVDKSIDKSADVLAGVVASEVLCEVKPEIKLSEVIESIKQVLVESAAEDSCSCDSDRPDELILRIKKDHGALSGYHDIEILTKDGKYSSDKEGVAFRASKENRVWSVSLLGKGRERSWMDCGPFEYTEKLLWQLMGQGSLLIFDKGSDEDYHDYDLEVYYGDN